MNILKKFSHSAKISSEGSKVPEDIKLEMLELKIQ
jgi:hypothetical protein